MQNLNEFFDTKTVMSDKVTAAFNEIESVRLRIADLNNVYDDITEGMEPKTATTCDLRHIAARTALLAESLTVIAAQLDDANRKLVNAADIRTCLSYTLDKVQQMVEGGAL